MRDKGFFGIGVEKGKTEFNYWSLFRTAQVLNADFLFIIGARFKRHAADTMHSYRHMPVYEYNDLDNFLSCRPFSCRIIGIEMLPQAIEISSFEHPKQAIYLLGAEDNGLSRKARNQCNAIVKLYGERSLNVAVAGSIVLYDRIVKMNNKSGLAQ